MIKSILNCPLLPSPTFNGRARFWGYLQNSKPSRPSPCQYHTAPLPALAPFLLWRLLCLGPSDLQSSPAQRSIDRAPFFMRHGCPCLLKSVSRDLRCPFAQCDENEAKWLSTVILSHELRISLLGSVMRDVSDGSSSLKDGALAIASTFLAAIALAVVAATRQ